MNTWYVKIGNSEVVAWNGAKIFHRFKTKGFRPNSFLKKLKAVDQLFIASVVPRIEKNLCKTAKQQKIRTKIVKVPDVPMTPAYKKNLGIDRLLNVYAAAALLNKAKKGAVVDLGTAITVDFFKTKKHLGGWILPGQALMAESLAKRTAKLPLFNFKKTFGAADRWAKKTQESLAFGQKHLIRGLLSEVERVSKKTFKSKSNIILTGGSALAFKLLSRKYKMIKYLPYLSLIALKLLDRSSSRR